MDPTVDTGRLSRLYLFITKIAWVVWVIWMVTKASHAPLHPKGTSDEPLQRQSTRRCDFHDVLGDLKPMVTLNGR